MNKNALYNFYFFLLQWLLFVATYEALAAYSIDNIVSIIERFDNTIWDSLIYLFSTGVGKDPFLLMLTKIAFFFPLLFLFYRMCIGKTTLISGGLCDIHNAGCTLFFWGAHLFAFISVYDYL